MTPWTWIVEQLARTERGTSLALFRIAVGLVISAEFFLVWATGAAELLWHDRAHGGFRASIVAHHWLGHFLGAGPETVDGLLAFAIVAPLLIALGIGARPLAVATLFAIQFLFALSSGSGGGHDRMFQISLFVLALADSEATLSLRCRLRTGSWTSERLVTAWPRDLLIWNLTLIYTAAGITKLAPEWMPFGDFRAVYNALLTPHWARADWSWLLGSTFPLTQLGTLFTLIWEASFVAVPLWLLLRARPRTGWKARLARIDVRSIYVGIGLVMHGTLLVMANLGPFTAITWAWYLVLYRPDEYAALWNRLTSRTQQPQPST